MSADAGEGVAGVGGGAAHVGEGFTDVGDGRAAGRISGTSASE
jgi:hypothetical protein